MVDRDKLIQDNIPFVYYIIHKYYPTFSKDEDIIQSGMVGLVKAANKFDASKGKFSTYAGVIIKNEIAKELKLRVNDSITIPLSQLQGGGTEW